MSQIIGGKITFGRTVNPAQYESKKAEVEISFVVAEGEDFHQIAQEAAAFAEDKALEMVGLLDKPIPKVAVAPPKATDTKEEYAERAKAEEAKLPPPLKRPPGRPPSKPTAPTADELDDAPVEDVETAEPAKAITDKDLTDAITRQQHKINNAPEIRKLIAKFNNEVLGKQSRDIPQSRRAEFLLELSRLA